MSGNESRRASGTAILVLAGLLASPAAAVWLGCSGRPRFRWLFALLRVLAALLTLALAAVLATTPLRWYVLAGIWWAYTLGGTAFAWLLLRGRAGATEPAVPRTGLTFRALIAAFAATPPLIIVAQLLGAATIGPLGVRLYHQAADPSTLGARIVLATLIAGPLIAFFAVLSVRRGRLVTTGDVTRAGLSILWLLLLWEILVYGSESAIRRQLVSAAGAEASTPVLSLLLLSFVIAGIPLALGLAWGVKPAWRRWLAATTLVAAGLGHHWLLLGQAWRAHFVLARAEERRGDVPSALHGYGLSLVGHSSPAMESYLQHRIGLLQYKLGNDEKALAAFRLVSTTHNANRDLVRQASFYLMQLDQDRHEPRRVLEGVEVPTEHRDSYCAPNTLAMVLRYWGQHLTPGELGEEVSLIGFGTSGSDIRFAAERRGFEHRVVAFSSVEELHWLIDRGIPAMLYIPGHVLSVFGYDDRLGTLVSYDTATWDIWVDHPVHELVQEWAKTWFMLGVTLPRDSQAPEIVEARQRFSGARAEAAWRWWLAGESGWDRGQLRAALTADPSFFPAAFKLDRPAERPWLAANVDDAAMVNRAIEWIERPGVPWVGTAQGLADWYLSRRQYLQLLRLGEQLERRRRLEPIRGKVGIAAARLGKSDLAAYFLQDATDAIDLLAERLNIEIQAGQTQRAAETLDSLIKTTASPYGPADANAAAIVEVAMRLAEELQPSPGSAYMEEVYATYVGYRPDDVERQLRFAELNLERIASGESEDRLESLQRARRALHYALAEAETEADRQRARELLAEETKLLSVQGAEGTYAGPTETADDAGFDGGAAPPPGEPTP